jgi:hypothetical protein
MRHDRNLPETDKEHQVHDERKQSRNKKHRLSYASIEVPRQ